jgi:hypothetical protein
MGDGVAIFTNWEIATSHWIFNGVTGGGPSSWTTGHGFQINHTTANAIDVNPGSVGSDDITIKHVALIGNSTQGVVGIRAVPGSGTVTNLNVSYVYMNQIGNCPFLYVPVTDSIVEYSYLGTYTGDASNHSELMSVWGGSGNITFRYNVVTHVDSTGGIMFDNAGNASSYFDIYGNVFYKPSGDTWTGNNGVLGGWTGAGGEQLHNMRVYNNTFINIVLDILGTLPTTFSGNIAKNNIFYGSTSPDFAKFTTHDYNYFNNAGGTHSEANGSSGSGDPFVAYVSLNFRLVADVGNWTALSSPYNADLYGTTRTSSRGAIQFASSGTPSSSLSTGAFLGGNGASIH